MYRDIQQKDVALVSSESKIPWDDFKDISKYLSIL